MVYFCLKGTWRARAVHAQNEYNNNRVYTLAEILSNIYRNKRRKNGDLSYDHDLTNKRFGANLFLLKYIRRLLLARFTPLHSENVD